MSYDTKYILSMLAVAVFSAVIAVSIAAYKCKQQWRDSGFDCRFEIFAGCQIKMRDDHWIPADRYRELL